MTLILFLMYEACYNTDSFWAPYFRLLPLAFPGKYSITRYGYAPPPPRHTL